MIAQRRTSRRKMRRAALLLWIALALPAGDWPAAAASDAPAVFSGERAWNHLEALCALGPRVPGSAGHRAGRAYIGATLRAAGGRVQEQSFRHKAPGLPEAVELTNLIARFGPSGPGGLLLGTHWDSRPWADRDPDPSRRDEPILGANDGGSGTAVLLALAEGFSREAPQIPVTLVFFDGEDLGRAEQPEEFLAGSRYFAAHLPSPMPVMGLVIDMVGSESMVLTLEEYARQLFPDLARLIDELAAEVGVPGYQPESGPGVYDDHLPLIEAGLPTLLLVDFRDPHWHAHADRLEHCSPASLEATGRLLARLAMGDYLR